MNWQGSTLHARLRRPHRLRAAPLLVLRQAAHAVAHMVCGPTPDVAICDECIALAAEIVAESSATPPA